MDFIESCGHERLPFPEFVLPSPYLNLLLYPKPLQFARRNPLDPEKFVYLDGCVRTETEPYEVPAFDANADAPLIYFSFGSLGVADVELIERMIGVLGRSPYRVLANVGGYLDRYDEPPANVKLASWYTQAAVLPHCDVVIQHGGNNSFNETLYFGKAPLVMPFVWDGHDNAQRANDTGHGIGMHRYEWTDDELLGNIDRLLTDPSIRARLKETSAYMQASDGRMTAARRVDQLLATLG
jgi:UDP:flavonoid glycosyltransferase YjiC (YdhE family)